MDCRASSHDKTGQEEPKFTTPSGTMSGRSPAVRGIKKASIYGIMQGTVLALLAAISSICGPQAGNHFRRFSRQFAVASASDEFAGKNVGVEQAVDERAELVLGLVTELLRLTVQRPALSTGSGRPAP